MYIYIYIYPPPCPCGTKWSDRVHHVSGLGGSGAGECNCFRDPDPPRTAACRSFSQRPAASPVTFFASKFGIGFGIDFGALLVPKMEPKWTQNGAKIIKKSLLNFVPFSVPFLIDFWMIFGARTLQKTMVSPYRSCRNRTSRPFRKKSEKVAKTARKRRPNGAQNLPKGAPKGAPENDRFLDRFWKPKWSKKDPQEVGAIFPFGTFGVQNRS